MTCGPGLGNILQNGKACKAIFSKPTLFLFVWRHWCFWIVLGLSLYNRISIDVWFGFWERGYYLLPSWHRSFMVFSHPPWIATSQLHNSKGIATCWFPREFINSTPCFFCGANTIQIVAIPSFSSLHLLVSGNWGHLGPSWEGTLLNEQNKNVNVCM